MFVLANPTPRNFPLVQTLTLQIENKGTIEIQVFPDKAPLAVQRVTQLASSGFYDKQRFHRVVKSPRPYLVQVGDPDSKSGNLDESSLGKYRSGKTVPYENSGLRNLRGAVGLSRLESSKDSGDTQFYILLGDYPFLDGQYTVFGKVSAGMDVVDRIEVGDRVVRASFSE